MRGLLPRAASRTSARSQYVSKQDALAEQQRKYPEAYDLLGLQPAARHLPRHAAAPGQRAEAPRRAGAATAGGGRTTIDPAIDVVKTSRDETKKILVATRVVKLATGLLAGLLDRRVASC